MLLPFGPAAVPTELIIPSNTNLSVARQRIVHHVWTPMHIYQHCNDTVATIGDAIEISSIQTLRGTCFSVAEYIQEHARDTQPMIDMIKYFYHLARLARQYNFDVMVSHILTIDRAVRENMDPAVRWVIDENNPIIRDTMARMHEVRIQQMVLAAQPAPRNYSSSSNGGSNYSNGNGKYPPRVSPALAANTTCHKWNGRGIDPAGASGRLHDKHLCNGCIRKHQCMVCSDRNHAAFQRPACKMTRDQQA